MREYLCVYHGLIETLDLYDDAEAGRLIKAMLRYSAYGEDTSFDGVERFIWPTLRQTIDRDKASYDKKSGANARNGALGGRPRKDAPAGEALPAPEPFRDEKKNKRAQTDFVLCDTKPATDAVRRDQAPMIAVSDEAESRLSVGVKQIGPDEAAESFLQGEVAKIDKTAVVADETADASADTDTVLDMLFKRYAGEDGKLREALAAFADMRREKGEPLDERSAKALFAVLSEYPPETRAGMLGQSVLNRWLNVYPLKKASGPPGDKAAATERTQSYDIAAAQAKALKKVPEYRKKTIRNS